MPFFVGFDCLTYPGIDEMTWLKANTNLGWCGFYLAPAPSHSDSSWRGSRSDLVALGWGLLPIYVGQQTTGPGSHSVSGAQGTLDGGDAAALAAAAGFPNGAKKKPTGQRQRKKGSPSKRSSTRRPVR